MGDILLFRRSVSKTSFAPPTFGPSEVNRASPRLTDDGGNAAYDQGDGARLLAKFDAMMERLNQAIREQGGQYHD